MNKLFDFSSTSESYPTTIITHNLNAFLMWKLCGIKIFFLFLMVSTGDGQTTIFTYTKIKKLKY